MYHVFSTLANSTRYVKYRKPLPGQHNTPDRAVLIKGGSGIHQKHVGTPYGIHTAVPDEDMEWLKDDLHFKQHVKTGYLTVRKGEANPEVVAKDMVTHDRKTDAAPVTPGEFDADGDRETIKPAKRSKAA